jgi:dihydroorotase
VCHVSTGEAARIARESGSRTECTIYHSLMNQGHLERLGAWAKMNPPLRSGEESGFILESLLSGGMDFIGTDHAPHTRKEKSAGFMEAPCGVPSVEHYGSFAALLLERGMSPQALARATSYNAAKFFGLQGKGRIEEGFRADLAVLDTASGGAVKPPYQTKCGWSPLEGMRFPGGVSYAIRRGRIIVDRGKLVA